MTYPIQYEIEQSIRKPAVRAAFPSWPRYEMICSIICKQISKRDDGYGSVRSRTAAVDRYREASDCGGVSGASHDPVREVRPASTLEPAERALRPGGHRSEPVDSGRPSRRLCGALQPQHAEEARP